MEPGHPPQSDQMEGKEGKTGIILGSGEFLLKHLSIYIYVKKKKKGIYGIRLYQHYLQIVAFNN